MPDFLNDLQDPAYRHVLLNHLPITGLAAATLALLVSFFVRHRAARIPALVAVLVMAASAFPAYESGSDAYREIRRLSDDAGADWLDTHADRADRAVGAFYGLAALAVLSLVLPVKWPRTALPLSMITLLGAFACIGLGGWIAEAGGLVRHAEFRKPTSPTEAIETP